MRARFTQSFRKQAVEKAVSRAEGISVRELSNQLGVGYSTLQKWIKEARSAGSAWDSISERHNASEMTKEKRPQDWSLEERLNLVIRCQSLQGEALSALCREHGLYPHHVNQWRKDFIRGVVPSKHSDTDLEIKRLKREKQSLQKEVTRKDKALAEAAALLVLQKKVNALWNNDEDN